LFCVSHVDILVPWHTSEGSLKGLSGFPVIAFGRLTLINLLKMKLRLLYLRLSPYRAVNTFHHTLSADCFI
jgi:hypothetical protein